MLLFFVLVFLGGAAVVGALVKLSDTTTRPRREAPESAEYDVWGRPRDRETGKTGELPAMGAARLS